MSSQQLTWCMKWVYILTQVLDSSSQFYLYRNFIHLLFPDQVKIFFGQYN